MTAISVLPQKERCAILPLWETIEPGGSPSISEGLTPPDKRKEGRAAFVVSPFHLYYISGSRFQESGASYFFAPAAV